MTNYENRPLLQTGFEVRSAGHYIVNLLADYVLGMQREASGAELPQAYKIAFDAIVPDPHQELAIVEKNGEIIATFQLSFIQYLTHHDGLRAKVEAVRIIPAYRGKGIGKEVFNYIIERARQRVVVRYN